MSVDPGSLSTGRAYYIGSRPTGVGWGEGFTAYLVERANTSTAVPINRPGPTTEPNVKTAPVDRPSYAAALSGWSARV